MIPIKIYYNVAIALLIENPKNNDYYYSQNRRDAQFLGDIRKSF